jgi:vitamin B12 transporter
MYGADAGGVINMYTAKPEAGFAGGLNVEGGRYDTQQYAGHVAGGNELVDFALNGARFETDGFNALTTDTELADDDGYKNTTLHGRAGWNITDQLRAELVARNVEGDNDYDDCSLPVTFDRTDKCTDDYSLDAGRVALIHQGDLFANSLSFNEKKTDRKYYTEGFNDYSYKSELERIDYIGSWKHSDTLTMIYGADLEKDSIDDGVTDDDRDQEGYYLEYKGGFSDSVYLTAGARYTDNEDFGTKTTYRTGAVYLVQAGDGEVKFKGTYGTGFRAPSLYEISYNNGPYAYPPASDLELDAEDSKGYDLGAGYFATSSWYVEMVYFDQTVSDEIYFDLIDYSVYLQGNGDSSSQGVELTSEVPVTEILSLSGNYTYTDTQDSEGEQRLRTPENMANLGVLISPWNGKLTFSLNYRIARDNAEDVNGRVDDYEVLDLSASYQILAALEVYGRIDNVTDEDYQEIPNYNTPGAAGYAGIRYTF